MSAPAASAAGPRERSVLVVEDDAAMRDSLTHLLEAGGWRVVALGDPTRALKRLAEMEPDVMLCDFRMPKLSGLELLQALPTGAPPVVLISAHGDIPMVVEAMSAGAYSFLEKPFDPRRLLLVLRNAAQSHRLSRDAERLRARLASLSGLDQVLLGAAPAIAEVREQVIDLAPLSATVMLLGETGVGKELVARALHDLSPWAGGPFVAVNCAAIPSEAFEARMFGAAAPGGGPVDGAASEIGVGAMARAHGGTLFLDELGAASLEVQAKFLRVLETKEIAPLGAAEPRRVDIRVISASNQPLGEQAADGRFREDLFYRLGAHIISLPPLRERTDDIPLLFQHFAGRYAELYEIAEPELSAEDLAAMMSHAWPGNVRELRNVAERRVLAAKRGRGSVAEAIGRDDEFGDVPETLREAVAAFERQLIGRAIRTHAGRMDAVAEALGIGRRTLNEKIVKLGLDKAELI